MQKWEKRKKEKKNRKIKRSDQSGKRKCYQVQCTVVHVSCLDYPSVFEAYHFVLQIHNTERYTSQRKDAKFASLFVLKSEMKINRNRIQNSCAYFSRFCFHRARFPFLQHTNFWQIVGALYAIQTTWAIVFMYKRKSDFSVECLDFAFSNYAARMAVVILIGQIRFSESFACIELEIDFQELFSTFPHTWRNHSLHSFTLCSPNRRKPKKKKKKRQKNERIVVINVTKSLIWMFYSAR